MEKIDFVVTWVDGNDIKWKEEREKYATNNPSDNAVTRFRDWGLMKYWFRGVEKFAPWVNHIYFVTWGHYPEWLNVDHPQLKVINHKDYIPQKYLPTFNSNVIEMNLHRIKDLEEQFVLFNDDMFLIDDVSEQDFFKKGKPRDSAILGQTFGVSIDDVFSRTIFNNISLINKYFNKKDVIKKHWRKFFYLKYGRDILRNIILLPFSHFSGFLDYHLPASHLKSTFFEVWEKERFHLDEFCCNRYRSTKDITHWFVKNWRFCRGQFEPRSANWGKSFAIGTEGMIESIKKQKYKAICVNDCDENVDFKMYQKLLSEAFEVILPQKSSFER